MLQDKVGAATGIIGKTTGALASFLQWIIQFITLRNMLIVMGIWFLIWYWLKMQEERYKQKRTILPYR